MCGKCWAEMKAPQQEGGRGESVHLLTELHHRRTDGTQAVGFSALGRSLSWRLPSCVRLLAVLYFPCH